MNKVVSYTNDYAKTFDVTLELHSEEFMAFIGVLLYAGVTKSSKESVNSLWDERHGRTFFSIAMTKRRFKEILRYLRFDSKSDRAERRLRDKMCCIREIFDDIIQRFNTVFTPSSEVTIDEQLLSFRGRCGFKMFIASKPGKYGLKIFLLVD